MLTYRSKSDEMHGCESATPRAFLPAVAAAVTNRDLRTLAEAADFARVRRATVRRWVRLGYLSDLGTPGKRLIDWDELVAFLDHGPSKRPKPPKR